MIIKNLLDKKTWRFYSFSLFWAGVILFVCFWNGDDIPSNQNYILAPDKLIHFSLFFVFTFSLFISCKKEAFYKQQNGSNTKCFILVLTLALLTELIQWSIPSRSLEWADFGTNIFGIVIAVFLLRWILGKNIFFKHA